MDWQKVRDQFPITKEYLYFDSAHKSPLPLYTTNALQDFFLKQQINGGNRTEWYTTIEETRKNFATLINAEPEEIAFTKNTSEGLNIAAWGIPFKPGDNVILNDNEHPNNIYCWLALAAKGVEVRWAKTKDGEVTAESIEALIDENTKAVSCSFVTFMPGNRNDIKAISELVKPRGIYVIVDAVQGLGSMNLDVKDMGIDMMSISAYKGLHGPYGVGAFFCRKDIIKDINPQYIARSSMIAEIASKHESKHYSICLSETATRFEFGNPNYPAIVAFNEALKFINSLGIKNIQSHLLELSGYFTQQILSLGLEILSPLAENKRSGIIGFKIDDPVDLNNWLLARKAIISPRKDAIRASVSIYSNKQDIDKLVDLLKEYQTKK